MVSTQWDWYTYRSCQQLFPCESDILCVAAGCLHQVAVQDLWQDHKPKREYKHWYIDVE